MSCTFYWFSLKSQKIYWLLWACLQSGTSVIKVFFHQYRSFLTFVLNPVFILQNIICVWYFESFYMALYCEDTSYRTFYFLNEDISIPHYISFSSTEFHNTVIWFVRISWTSNYSKQQHQGLSDRLVANSRLALANQFLIALCKSKLGLLL